MAGAKETPRQKMIGMMYLVLTALLALNVSKSILQSFVRVNQSLEITNENFMKKNNKLYSEFQNKLAADREKTLPYWKRARYVRSRADSLYDHINEMKTYLKQNVDGLPKDTAKKTPLKDISGLSNYDVPSQKMGLAAPASPKGKEWGKYTAKELENKIEAYRAKLLKLLADSTQLDTTKTKLNNLKTEGKPEAHDPAAHNWGGLYFYHAPLAAVITTLTKIQSDIRNAESDVVSALLSQVSAEDFKFDTLAPKVVPKNGSYIAVGDTYKAEVLVAAWNSTRNPAIRFGSGENIDTAGNLIGKKDTGRSFIKNGLGYYEFVPKKPGNTKWAGEIGIQGPSGDMSFYSLPVQSVRAAEQNVVVSPTKMNVLYRGLDNPISVSVPGMAAEDLKASISSGTMRKTGPGQYMASPGSGGSVTITVSDAKTGERLGDMKFRCQDVPDPQPYFSGYTTTDSKISKNALKMAGTVKAKLKDFLFKGVKFRITQFEVGASIGGQFPTEMNKGGGKLTKRQRELIKNAQRGGRVEVRKIKAVGPAGESRRLAGMSFQVK
ncbi:MAG: gliding motility protein GldM [Flavobacteriales bacterium]